MNDSLKKAVIIFTSSALIFILLKKVLKYDKKDLQTSRSKYLKPSIAEEDIKDELTNNAFIALEAYIDAWNSGESLADIKELNKELSKQFGVTVEKEGLGLIVKDVKGEKIIKYNQ